MLKDIIKPYWILYDNAKVHKQLLTIHYFGPFSQEKKLF